MKPVNRKIWLESEISKHEAGVDILNSDFVFSYINATDEPFSMQFFGAPKCATLGRDLAAMFRAGILNRAPVGIPDGLSSQGFPKWIYRYNLNGEFK